MFLTKLKDITTFIFDIDGVLTDGTTTVTETGAYLRSFNIKDGYAMQLALKRGFRICIISGAKGPSVETRFKNLGVEDTYFGIDNKLIAFESYLQFRNLDPTNILYVGDDIPDRDVMRLTGLAACPEDAVSEIKAVSHYISPFGGGKGAVRDIIEKVLQVQGKWFDEAPSASKSAV